MKKGFTIVEITIVIVVIAVLATIGLIGYNAVIKSARDTAVKNDGAVVASELQVYALRNSSRATAWFSGDPKPSGFNVKLSGKNIVDIVISGNAKDWCVRALNTSSSYATVDTAFTRESQPGVCANIPPSDQAYMAAVTSGWRTVETGYYHTCGIAANNFASCWGARDNYQGGNGSMTNSGTPQPITVSGALGGRTVTNIIGGGFHSCVIDSNGDPYCWGKNDESQLGDGTSNNSNVPVAVDRSGVLNGKDLTLGAGAGWHTCARSTDYKAYCWGYGGSGVLGTGSYGDSATPLPVLMTPLNGDGIRDIQAGPNNTCAVSTSGAAYCWGSNSYGQLGNGTNYWSSAPVRVLDTGVLAGKTVRKVATYEQTCAIDSDARALCWGKNDTGQVGNGGTANVSTPVAVSTAGVLNGKKMASIATALGATCAIDMDGKAYCWGLNNYGQLGNGSTTNSLTPVAVTTSGALSGKKLWSIKSGADFFCASAVDGTAYCWGRNVYGMLGNGSMSNMVTTPVQVLKP